MSQKSTREYPDIARDPWEENWLIGSVLRWGPRVFRPAAWLNAEDFPSFKLQSIWTAIEQCVSETEEVSYVAVYRALESRQLVNSVGGMSGLLEFDDRLPEPLNVLELAKAIRRRSQARRLYAEIEALALESGQGIRSPEDLILEVEEKMAKIKAMGPMEGPDSIADRVGSLDEFFATDKPGIPVPLSSLQRLTGGMKRGDYWIVGARPSMGKTAFAISLAYGAAVRGFRVGFFSIEMTSESVIKRIVSMISSVENYKVQNGTFSQAERVDVMAAMRSLPTNFHIYSRDIPTPEKISAIVEAGGTAATGERFPFDVVFIDYLQLMSSPKKHNTPNEEISHISKSLKRLARDKNIPVIVCSQLNRALENRAGDKRPQLSDLRDSGSLEQDADVIAFLFRESYYKRDDPSLDRAAELIVSKNRAGDLGTIRMDFDRRYGVFTE